MRKSLAALFAAAALGTTAAPAVVPVAAVAGTAATHVAMVYDGPHARMVYD